LTHVFLKPVTFRYRVEENPLENLYHSKAYQIRVVIFCLTLWIASGLSRNNPESFDLNTPDDLMIWGFVAGN